MTSMHYSCVLRCCCTAHSVIDRPRLSHVCIVAAPASATCPPIGRPHTPTYPAEGNSSGGTQVLQGSRVLVVTSFVETPCESPMASYLDMLALNNKVRPSPPGDTKEGRCSQRIVDEGEGNMCSAAIQTNHVALLLVYAR